MANRWLRWALAFLRRPAHQQQCAEHKRALAFLRRPAQHRTHSSNSSSSHIDSKPRPSLFGRNPAMAFCGRKGLCGAPMPHRPLKTRPKQPQHASKVLRDGFGSRPGTPRAASGRPWDVPSSPGAAPGRPKQPWGRPEGAPRRPQEPPRGSPKQPREGPGTSQAAPGTPQDGPETLEATLPRTTRPLGATAGRFRRAFGAAVSSRHPFSLETYLEKQRFRVRGSSKFSSSFFELSVRLRAASGRFGL